MVQSDIRNGVLGLSREALIALWKQSQDGNGIELPITKGAKLYCAKSGRETVLFSFPGIRQAKIKSAKGFTVKIKTSEKDGTALVVENNSDRDEDLFAYVVLDLLELDFRSEKQSAERRFNVIVSRMKAWRQFMKDRGRRLTASQELGLAGELFFLKSCLERNISISFLQSFWTGPLRSARDFAFGGDVYAEVKTSTVPLPLRVKIDSLEQLDVASVRTLLLCAVVMQTDELTPQATGRSQDQSDRFQTLDQIAEEVESKIQPACLKEEFKTLLVIAGLSEEQRKESRRRFCPQSLQFFRAEHLPRLTPGKIPGIIKATYEIELLDASGVPAVGSENAQIEESEAWKLLIASGAAEPLVIPDDPEDQDLQP